MKSCRKIAAVLILGVAAVCLSSGSAKGQDVSSGTFTLPREAQWGKHILPKGTYNYTARKNGMMGAMVTITGTNDSSDELQLMGIQRSPDASLKGAGSSVVVAPGADGDIIQGIYLAESGVEYLFPVHARKNPVLAKNSKPGEAGKKTQRIPISPVKN